MQSHRGIFITFEGSEGSGKSTQIQRLARRLEVKQHKVLVTREPGGTEIGEYIRTLLKDPELGKNMFPETELLLFGASRAQLVREVIIPRLKAGYYVLCDRFLDSTVVYQGLARNIPNQFIETIIKLAINDTLPDLTIVLDIPAEVGFERIRKNRSTDAPDRMEMESLEFYKKVREGFHNEVEKENVAIRSNINRVAKDLPSRFFVVDGTQNVDTVETIIWHEINRRFS